jgi:PPOX class probable F420-dependent enzyme
VADIPETHRDLLDAQFAVFGTIDGSGSPQLTMIWFMYANGAFRLSLNDSRAKTRNIRARPQCSLLIPDVSNPYRYLEVRGRARLDDDADGAFVALVKDKYGADVTEYDQPGEKRLAVTVEPDKVYAVDMSAG